MPVDAYTPIAAPRPQLIAFGDQNTSEIRGSAPPPTYTIHGKRGPEPRNLCMPSPRCRRARTRERSERRPRAHCVMRVWMSVWMVECGLHTYLDQVSVCEWTGEFSASPLAML